MQKFNNVDSAIEEAMADERLNSIDIDYIIDQIDSQLDNLLSSSNKTNFLKYFNKQLEDVSRIKSDFEISNIRDNINETIIKNICDRFNMVIDMDNIDTKKVAKHFYKFFVLNYNDNISFFVKSYITENKDSLIHSLKHMDHVNVKKIPELNSDISIIVNNIGDVIDIINASDIDFVEFLKYLHKHPEANSTVNEMIEYADTIIYDEGDVVANLLEPVVNEEEDFGEIYVNIQMDLYSNFSEE